MNFLKALFQSKPKIKKIDITRRFELIGRVGQGSMSKVWRARDTASGRIVALKVLDKEKTQKLEARFAGLKDKKPSEGEIALQLKHPNIVRTFEYGYTLEGEQFLVMEFIEGVGLSFLVDSQNQLMRERRLDLMLQLGQAIEHFHEQNWIHRDICPRNVMVSTDNQVKLIDFGLVVPNTPEFQKPGNRTGTADYMAPELVKRQSTDQRIDIFSYAVTCFEMYAKQRPWDSSGQSLDKAIQRLNTPPADIRELVPGIDPQIADAIMKGLAQNPRERWPFIGEMIEQFREADRRAAKTA